MEIIFVVVMVAFGCGLLFYLVDKLLKHRQEMKDVEAEIAREEQLGRERRASAYQRIYASNVNVPIPASKAGMPSQQSTFRASNPSRSSSGGALIGGVAGYMLGSSGNAQASDYAPSYSGSGGTSGGAGSSSSYDSCSSSSSSSSSSDSGGSCGGGGSD